MDYTRHIPIARHKRLKGSTGQAVLEFTFSIFVIFLFIYAFIKVFQWTGIGLAERRQIHEKVLTRDIIEGWSTAADGPLKQIDPFFYKQRRIKAVWGE